jgi:hypothetical protein
VRKLFLSDKKSITWAIDHKRHDRSDDIAVAANVWTSDTWNFSYLKKDVQSLKRGFLNGSLMEYPNVKWF